jgi:hypothetical protein
VAIANGRLRTLDPTARTLTFTYKDYADASRIKTLTLTGVEFIRRLRLHLLPRASPKSATTACSATIAATGA